MDHKIVSQFLLSNGAAKFAEAYSNPDPDVLDKAQAKYVAHNGRLPSPPPPERLQPSKTFEVFVSDFSSGIRNFLQKSRDKDAEEAFNCQSWEELELEAAKALEAVDTHDQRRRNWRNPFEFADKVGGVVARRIEFLVELVPEGEYTGILTGALRLLCNTAKRKKEIRNKILEALQNLSHTISHTKAEIRLYSRDQTLKDKSEILYMALLDFVRAAVAYLDKNSALQSFRAFFQQQRHGSELDDTMGAVEAASASFENCVSVCFQLRVQRIDSNVESLKNPIFNLYFLLADTAKNISSQLKQLMEAQQATKIPTLQFMYLPTAPPSISTQQLQQLLSGGDWQTGAMSVVEDLQRARRFVPSPLHQEKIGLLLSKNEFLAWIKSLASGLVILHDENSLEGNSSLSVLSYLSAIISEMLCAPGIFLLTFFCGLHCTAGSVPEGAHTIIRSLALQLLRVFGSVNLNTPCDPGLVIQGLLMNDLSTVCSVFTMLLQNIPAGVIYVIVDGASWYATEARSEDMQAAMLYLNQLVMEVQAASRGLVLKVLITNPTPRQRNSWGFQACDIYLEQSLLTGGHQGRIG
ncbi:hypothetical protein NUW58_g4490 [Xylaria curta]|uniref:Uncharacterized protein n=1 Tax=Xylaria curta TaxID=42375 RepID=A0ACC1P7U6_9PEZI|nr:hypothetical protein NUW58_g4490 [Xylaria curta]